MADTYTVSLQNLKVSVRKKKLKHVYKHVGDEINDLILPGPVVVFFSYSTQMRMEFIMFINI